MGEIAEMMLEGILCEGCGTFIDEHGPGHPRYCSKACHPINLQVALKRPTWEKTPAAKRAAKHNHERRERAKEAGKKFGCDKCSKLCRTPEGLAQHKIDKHASLEQSGSGK